MTPPIPGGFLIYTKFAVENKVHYLVFRVQTVLRKVFGNRRVTVLLMKIQLFFLIKLKFFSQEPSL